uniref:Putative secreted protein n=1 Tax=Ixodes ricinus TaxID=34613 RepID=A0A6B0UAX8_IXORI
MKLVVDLLIPLGLPLCSYARPYRRAIVHVRDPFNIYLSADACAGSTVGRFITWDTNMTGNPTEDNGAMLSSCHSNFLLNFNNKGVPCRLQ